MEAPPATADGQQETMSAEAQQGNALPPFISKLHELVSNSVYADHIRWGDAGDTIVVTDPVLFARDVLPRFFKHDNIRSFVRQLNIYGFQRCRRAGSSADGMDSQLEFYHESFMKGKEEIMKQITRGVPSQKRAAPGDPPSAGKLTTRRPGKPTGEKAQQMHGLQNDILRTANQLRAIDEQLRVHMDNSQMTLMRLMYTLNSSIAMQQRLPAPAAAAAPPLPPHQMLLPSAAQE